MQKDQSCPTPCKKILLCPSTSSSFQSSSTQTLEKRAPHQTSSHQVDKPREAVAKASQASEIALPALRLRLGLSGGQRPTSFWKAESQVEPRGRSPVPLFPIQDARFCSFLPSPFASNRIFGVSVLCSCPLPNHQRSGSFLVKLHPCSLIDRPDTPSHSPASTNGRSFTVFILFSKDWEEVWPIPSVLCSVWLGLWLGWGAPWGPPCWDLGQARDRNGSEL